jgi:hypothetical protein
MLAICKYRLLRMPCISLMLNPFSATLLGMAQDAAHEASAKTPKSLLIRARKSSFHRFRSRA